MSEKKRISKMEKQRLFDLVKRINLVHFITSATGADAEEGNTSWKMVCPMPFHNDNDPSFHIYHGTGHWFYKCYGCDSRGSIIDFCLDFFSMETPEEALLYILEHHGIEGGADFMEKAIKEAKVNVNSRTKMECAHFVASSTCHRLLRMHPSSQDIRSWIAKAYMGMNRMLEEGDTSGIEKMSESAGHLLSLVLDAPKYVREMELEHG